MSHLLKSQITNESLTINHIDMKDTAPMMMLSPKVLDFWSRLHKNLAKQPSTNNINQGRQQMANKVVRIFVSSTFTDFFNERDILIKKVFPALREQMEPSGIQIIDCDLRWGVPTEFTTDQTILTCFEELDRCFEDNGQPFFIGLVSDKYGWIPEIQQLSANIIEDYHWIEGASITLMEFIHGAFRTHNPNACFLLRKSEALINHIPDEFMSKFVDIDELGRQQVQELKRQLPKMFPRGQVFEYDCAYNGIDASTGRQRVKIGGFQEFEQQVTAFLTRAIQQWYPNNFENVNKTISEQEQTKTFLINKTQFFVDRPHEFSILLKYISGDHKDLPLLINNPHRDDTANSITRPMLALSGRSGDGKTMLLSKLVLTLEEKEQQNLFLFYYMVDSAAHANPSEAMFEGLIKKLETFVNDNNLVSPVTGDQLKCTDDEMFLSEAIAIMHLPVIIIIDGLERDDRHSHWIYDRLFPFSCLSALTSERTFIIVSCETNSKLHKTIQSYTYYELELLPFSIEQRYQYIDTFFRRFNKTLESEQMSLLLANTGCEHPVYLAYICENLRQFGDYSLVTKRLKTYPQILDELLDFLLDEVYASIDNLLIVDVFFKLLLISNIGILESEIVNMLQCYLTTNDKNGTEVENIMISPMTWSTLRRQIKTFLDTTWIRGNQLIIFRHASFEQKLQQRFFKDDNDTIRHWHRFMADFFTKHGSVIVISRILYHYEQAQMYNELVMYLRSPTTYAFPPHERQKYFRKLRCPKQLFHQDSIFNQRAYLCRMCAMQYRVGPHSIPPNSCRICGKIFFGANMMQGPHMKTGEARLCQEHGSPYYPNLIKCFICKVMRPIPIVNIPSFPDIVPVIICYECSMNEGRPIPRCAAFLNSLFS